MKTLTISLCPTHGYYAVSIDDEDSGVRVTPSKCCGRWDTLHAFRMSAREWGALADLAAEVAIEAANAIAAGGQEPR